jgi:gliding motility-associated-like protein
MYRICNQDGCDSAMIKIYIRCPKVKVYNGFSPNDDGENETFTITDIDLFPNNEVTIYNRWGNEVYFKQGYNNEWKGTWNGKELPDGTYYYVLQLNDDEHTMLTGFLQIQR